MKNSHEFLPDKYLSIIKSFHTVLSQQKSHEFCLGEMPIDSILQCFLTNPYLMIRDYNRAFFYPENRVSISSCLFHTVRYYQEDLSRKN